MSNITLIFAESLKQNNMCWRPYNEKDTVAKKAKRAIIAYKVMHKRTDDEVESYYMNSCYTINKETTLGGGITPDECGAIGYGFHSYASNCVVKYLTSTWLNINCMPDNTYIATYEGPILLVKCIIPKNANYYKNVRGEIVSDKIIVTNEAIDSNKLEEIAKVLHRKGTFGKIFKYRDEIL